MKTIHGSLATILWTLALENKPIYTKGIYYTMAEKGYDIISIEQIHKLIKRNLSFFRVYNHYNHDIQIRKYHKGKPKVPSKHIYYMWSGEDFDVDWSTVKTEVVLKIDLREPCELLLNYKLQQHLMCTEPLAKALLDVEIDFLRKRRDELIEMDAPFNAKNYMLNNIGDYYLSSTSSLSKGWVEITA